MDKKVTTDWKRQMSENLKAMLGQKSPPLQKFMDRDMVAEIASGDPGPDFAQLIAKKVVELAAHRAKENRWAVELIFDRLEGKAAQTVINDDSSRQINERLDTYTIQHLNDMAKKLVSNTTEDDEPVPADIPVRNG